QSPVEDRVLGWTAVEPERHGLKALRDDRTIRNEIAHGHACQLVGRQDHAGRECCSGPEEAGRGLTDRGEDVAFDHGIPDPGNRTARGVESSEVELRMVVERYEAEVELVGGRAA